MSRILGIGLSVWISVLCTTASAQVCTITGDDTIECDGTTYRAVDDECVHYVDLTAHNANHPGVSLPDLKKTIEENYAAGAVPAPVVVELTDYVDCTQTDHNFTDANLWSAAAHPNQPSRLMNISGKVFRVTAAPDDGFATYYYSYDVTTGGTAGVPHLLVAESSNDQERYTSLNIHHADDITHPPSGLGWAPPYTGEPTMAPWGDPWWEQNPPRIQQGPAFGPGAGLAVYTGREWPIDHQPFNIPLVFHPKTTVTRIAVTSTGCNLNRTSTDGGAVSQMWVFRFVDSMSDRMPSIALPPDPDQQRRIGIYVTHPWYLYAHYGTPARLLEHRQAGLQRMVRHLKYCGMNYLVFNAINGADRSEKAWYSGSSYFSWNSAGDLLAELPPIAEAEGIELVPLITSLQKTATNGLSFSSDAYQMGSDGNYVRAFSNETLDPLHPQVQQVVFNVLGEIAARSASSSAVRGIGIRANGKIGTCYTCQQDSTRGAKLSGYSAWDLQQFKNDTGSGVPTSPPGTAYSWLVSRPTEWEAWINWRCAKTRDFWLACRDVIRSYRSDLVFYVQCDLPSEMPGTNIEWANGETPYDLLRHHGYDPEMFVDDSGIIISRGMMVAKERYKHATRWLPPWGTNYENYKLFHFAPGLAELYRTAEGRAAEMYQTYWEEAGNPYFEFGSPGDPNGFFRTNTPAAPGRPFFEGPIMSVRRQDPDTITWLGWNRPTLGHESEIRKFAQAFRALPAVDPMPFGGTLVPDLPNEVVARWHGNRLAVINDSLSARTITLNFAAPVPAGESLTNVVTGEVLIGAGDAERSSGSFDAEGFSLNVFEFSLPADIDFDGIPDATDNCPAVYNPGQSDGDEDGLGDACDNCPEDANPTQDDADLDQIGDACDDCPLDPGNDADGDGLCAQDDNCPNDANLQQEDSDTDGVGDVCDNCPDDANADQADDDNDGIGNECDPCDNNGGGSIVAIASYSFEDGTDGWVLNTTAYCGDGTATDVVRTSGDASQGVWHLLAPGRVRGDCDDGATLVEIAGRSIDTTGLTQLYAEFDLKFDVFAEFEADADFFEFQVDSGGTTTTVLRMDRDDVPAGNTTGWNTYQTSFFPASAENGSAIIRLAGLTSYPDESYRVDNVRIYAYQPEADDDGDGVRNGCDLCPDTVAGACVDGNGCPLPVRADFDGDGDVDATDLGVFQDCATGPLLGPPAAGCEKADFDGDSDVDQMDFGVFQRCLSGEGLAPPPDCAD